MTCDPMRWHEQVSAETLTLIISQMSARYLTLLTDRGGLPLDMAQKLVDEIFEHSVIAALRVGTVDQLEADSAREKGEIQ